MFKLLDVDWRGKLWVLGFLAESADEGIAILEEVKTVVEDPDLPDQEAASHRIVTLLFQVKRNYLGAPAESFAALPEIVSRDGALAALLPKVRSGKLQELLTWAIDHWDEFVKYVLPILLLLFKDELPPILKLRRAA